MVTFLLNNNLDEKHLDNDDFKIQNRVDVSIDIFKNLKMAMEWGIANDEDILYFICGNKWRWDFDFERLEACILSLAEQEIFTLFTGAESKEILYVNKDLSILNELQEVNSFIVMRPLFELFLSYIEVLDDMPNVAWMDFLQRITLHKFMLNNCGQFVFSSKKIHIISPFRNVGNYIKDCVASILAQDYKNYHVTFIDDYSQDGSSALIPEISCITSFYNHERKYALQNILDALTKYNDIDDETIVCILDGDDKLSHKYVLNILNAVYQDEKILLTYGSMSYFDRPSIFGTAYTKSEYLDLRNSLWKIAPLRTFKYKLFKKLKDLDPDFSYLRNGVGGILKMPADMALFFPLMELAGFQNTKFINTVLYNYRVHPNNDQSLYAREQFEGEQIVRKKKAFLPIF